MENYTNATLSQAAGYISKQEIVTATNNFSRQIGEGGYGPVFWGVLANGKEVAVKVNKILDQGTQEFVNEVSIYHRVHDLVRYRASNLFSTARMLHPVLDL